MSIAVWDTYVQRDDRRTMHFDILAPSSITDQATVFEYGNHYLKRKGITGKMLSSSECKFCHIEQGTEEQLAAIQQSGYTVIEMQHCN
jgi:hypothetical protein